MKSSLSKSVLLAAALLSTSVLSIAQNTVYDNTTTDKGQFYFSNNQYGDQINLLAGTDRTLSQFSFYYFFSGNLGSASAVLRFYDNTGAGGAPGNAFYTGDPFTLQNGNNTETINFSGATTPVILPDSFTWTIQFSSLGTDQAGLLLYGPPTVGSSFTDFWENTLTGWTPMGITGHPEGVDFAARVTAVPEPSVLALGALAALIGAAKYRKLRQ
jgi:hypothetical protein